MKHEHQIRIAIHLVVGAGLLVAVLAVSLDYILPDATPGINFVQLLIMALGLLTASIAWQLRRPAMRQKLAGTMRQPIAAGIIIALLTLVALEIVLSLFDAATYFPLSLPEIRMTLASWFVCEEQGCHYVYDEVLAACEKDILSGRVCTVNRQGYGDAQDFIAPDTYDNTLRVLALGDSFTFGYAADPGKSYVEFLESQFPGSEIWNVGISGTGTNQALAAFKHFSPQLRPQLTTLAFVNNDFGDNLSAFDSRFRVLTAHGNPAGLRSQQYDSWGNVYAVDRQSVMRYSQLASDPPRNGFEYGLGITRLGTLTLKLRDSLGTLFGQLWKKKIAVTKAYLADLRDLTRARGSALLVIIVPRRGDLNAPSDEYRAALELVEELGIPYLKPAHLLDASADFAIPPDEHWNSAGHQKVGAYVSDCVAVFSQGRDLSQCEGVVIGGDRQPK